MYLHLGQNTVVNEKDIVGIFDIEQTTVSKKTRDFLNNAGKKGNVVNVSFEIPKSFIVCKNKTETKVYISQLSTHTLQKRAENINYNFDIR